MHGCWHKAQSTPTATRSTALPELWSLRNLEGTVVTIDAMGCQGEVARQMMDQGGD